MNSINKLTPDEIKQLSSVGIIAQNWFAVCHDSTQMPIAIFCSEEYAIAYRDKFSATSIIEPWPMVIKDYRKQYSL